MSRVGIREVGRLAGVSVGTVSNYLNHPERVSAEKALRIQAAIDSIGFVPSNAGRQLRLGRSQVIGYLAPNVSNPYFADIAERVERRADERGVTVFLANSHRSREREDAYLAVFEQHRVQGILVASDLPIEERLAQVRSRGTPSVLVGQRARSLEQPSASLDGVAGGRRAMQHLIDLGCRRVMFVGGPMTMSQVADRFTGAADAAQAAGAMLEVIDLTDRTMRGGSEVGAMIAARAPEDRPDGIFAVNDLIALGILQRLVLSGIPVPADVAVVGYDDTDFADASLIPLTSVRARNDGLGVAILDLLFDVIAGAEIGDPHVLFEPELVIRASSSGFRPR